MPLTPMGFLMSRGFPSNESVLLSESLPSCPWTDCCSTPLSAARVDELIASGWLFNLPSTKSARDCRGFPSLESVHLLAVLPVVQGRASRVLSDSNNHPLAVPRQHLGLDTPANRDTAPKSSCGRMPDTTASDWPPKELIEFRCIRQEPTDPQCSFSLTTPGEPDFIAPKSHLGETRADPPIRHPKRKTSMASRFQQLAIPRSLPSVWCPWRTRSTGPTSDSRKSCCTRKDDRKPSTHDARRNCFHPPDAPGLLEPANRSQRTQIARWTSATIHPNDLSEERWLGLTATDLWRISGCSTDLMASASQNHRTDFTSGHPPPCGFVFASPPKELHGH